MKKDYKDLAERSIELTKRVFKQATGTELSLAKEIIDLENEFHDEQDKEIVDEQKEKAEEEEESTERPEPETKEEKGDNWPFDVDK